MPLPQTEGKWTEYLRSGRLKANHFLYLCTHQTLPNLSMKTFCWQKAVLATLLFAPFTKAIAQKNVAYQDSHARISIVTDGIARLEYAPKGQFEGRKSFVAINRNYPKTEYKVARKGRQVVISTKRMVIRYKPETGPFSAENLAITSSKDKHMLPFAWKPGMVDDKNLLGTYRTLDGYDGNRASDGKAMPIEEGLLSRNGWHFIDDSESYLYDQSDFPWVTTRRQQEQTQDWYFMAYGHDYKQALRDFAALSGKIPLPPRYAFGYWWSRYWSYTDNEMRDLVDRFNRYSIPLDVLVVDMDWHYTEKGKGGWTGYTWNKRLFPDPEGFIKWVRNNGLNITFNIHPASGVAPYEARYPEMARWMGLDPASKQAIPWVSSDKKFFQGFIQTQLHPMEKAGTSFWWFDWQQGLLDKKFPKLSNTYWINYVMFTDMQRNRTTRPMLYHRWGGLGNHRYQIGFSGDSKISWHSLNFQPYFNATASNVLYGYWSHDIGGHMGVDTIDPELYVRWMQFGCLSPILRTHSTKNAGLNKEPWAFDDKTYNLLRDVVLQRYRLAPYIYTMARKAYDEGISLCRPMYYDYPDNNEAYTNKNEYMFGDCLLVSPITKPMTDGSVTQNVWLPAGNDWYEVSSGTLLKGGQTVSRRFHLDEYPLYVKAGSIIPEYGTVKNLNKNDEPVSIAVYPGQRGTFSMYEDNGNDKDYATRYARTSLTAETTNNTLTIGIGARQGSYKNMPQQRQFYVKVIARAVPDAVSVNGKKAEWSYDGNTLTLTVKISETNCAQPKTVTITYPTDTMDVADGTIGLFRRIYQNNIALKKANAGIIFAEELGTMESTGRAITYHPEQFKQRMEQFRKNLKNLPDLLKKQKLSEQEIARYLQATY